MIVLLLFLWSLTAQAKDVLVSFDGSGRLDMWESTLAFSRSQGIRCTYFISAPYFVTRPELEDHPYWAVKQVGPSPIKFRESRDRGDIRKRFAFLNQAVAEGHEIGSHLCGHYEGIGWTEAMWEQEHDFFDWTFSRTGEFDVRQVVGIRAPSLGVNGAYFRVLKRRGFRYDSSLVDHSNLVGVNRPVANGEESLVPEIPIRRIKVVLAKPWLSDIRVKNLLPFDYEFALNASATFMRRIFFDSLCHDYLTQPDPTQVCLHFEETTGDPYWLATQDFIIWAKVRGATFKTYRETVL
jgi:hypothetical protein